MPLRKQVFLCAGALFSVASGECVISARQCNNFPEFNNSHFPDAHGHQYLGTAGSASKCARRAEDFHHWCGNGRGSEKALTAATHRPTMTSQIYHPTACDPKWSLYGKHCYIHVWEHKTFWHAEQWCQEQGGSLCSIHGPAENEFVFTLTKGISSWIGYQDVDQDEQYQWTDNTPANFENHANDCTGREHEPDCQPEQVAQKWHKWEGQDLGTWVCKKLAKWKLGLVRDSESVEKLNALEWEKFKKPHPEADLKPLSEPAKANSLEEPARPEKDLKLKEPQHDVEQERKECGDGKSC